MEIFNKIKRIPIVGNAKDDAMKFRGEVIKFLEIKARVCDVSLKEDLKKDLHILYQWFKERTDSVFWRLSAEKMDAKEMADYYPLYPPRFPR